MEESLKKLLQIQHDIQVGNLVRKLTPEYQPNVLSTINALLFSQQVNNAACSNKSINDLKY